MTERQKLAKEADKGRGKGGREASRDDRDAAGGDKLTLRQRLAKNYHELMGNPKLKAAAKKRFPHITYGEAAEKNPKQVSKSFPLSYKRYFFKLVKNIISAGHGRATFAKVPPSLVMTVGARERQMGDPVFVESKNQRL